MKWDENYGYNNSSIPITITATREMIDAVNNVYRSFSVKRGDNVQEVTKRITELNELIKKTVATYCDNQLEVILKQMDNY